MSLNVSRAALDVIVSGRIYYNQHKNKGPWSKAIGPFLMHKKEAMIGSGGEGQDTSAATAAMPTLTRHDRGIIASLERHLVRL